MQHEVFISYATEDRQKAEAVARALECAGIRCWYAPRDIAAGRGYAQAIVDAIAASRAVVLILSGKSNESRHVEREIHLACADEPGVPVVPVRVEEVGLNKALRFYLGSAHWFEAIAPPFDSHLPRLVEQMCALLGKPAPDAGATKPDAGSTPPEAPKPEPGAGQAREAEKVEGQSPQANAAPVPPVVSDSQPAVSVYPVNNVPPYSFQSYVPPPPPEPSPGVFLAPPLTAILSVLFVVSLLGIRVSTLRNPLTWGTVALLVLSTLVLLAVQVALYPLHMKLLGRPHRGALALALVLVLAGFIYGWSAQLKSADERASAAAESGNWGSITGKVTFKGKPVPGVNVTLQPDFHNGVPTQTATTDEKGVYRFPKIPQTHYNISVNEAGYEEWRDELLVPHEGTEIDIELKRAGNTSGNN